MPKLNFKTMIQLITVLISLLGYGQPEDYANWTEDQLVTEIQMVEAQQEADGGVVQDWEL